MVILCDQETIPEDKCWTHHLCSDLLENLLMEESPLCQIERSYRPIDYDENPPTDWMCIHNPYFDQGWLVDNRTMTSVRYFPEGLFNTLVRPLPWNFKSGVGTYTEGQLSRTVTIGAGLESTLLWLPLYGLSVYGLWAMRHHYRRLLYLFLTASGLIVSGAVTHGNLGTAFRHRGQMLFVLAILAAGGIQALVEARSKPSRLTPSTH